MNDITFFVEQSNICNLVDDNTLYLSGKNEQVAVEKIMHNCNRIIDQFQVNSLSANPKICL